MSEWSDLVLDQDPRLDELVEYVLKTGLKLKYPKSESIVCNNLQKWMKSKNYLKPTSLKILEISFLSLLYLLSEPYSDVGITG